MLRNNNVQNTGNEIKQEAVNSDTGNVYYSFFKKKARHIYADQLICLCSLLIMAVWQNGWRAFMLVAISALVSVFVDIICCRMTGKIYNPKDLSTITAGICIALMMPASVPYSMVVFGSAMAMGVKHIFGGKDNYIFNPTAVAVAFLIICYPTVLLLFPKTGESLPIFGEVNVVLSSGIESYLMKMGTAQQLSVYDMLLGNFQGPMGTKHTLVILVCAVCLMFRRSISTIVTSSALGIIIIITSLFPLYDNFANMLALELIGGYLLFGLLFLANDPQTIPATGLGKLLYGIALGISVIMFRYFGKVEGSSLFALLVANALSVRADRAASKILSGLYNLNVYLKERLTFYERFTQSVKEGREVSVKNISDTQEIIINPINYDMPPIDNKVIKINRKKQNLLALTIEKLRTLGKNGSTKVKKQKINKPKPVKKEITIADLKKIPLIGSLLAILANRINIYKETSIKKKAVNPVKHTSQAVQSESGSNLADNTDVPIVDNMTTDSHHIMPDNTETENSGNAFNDFIKNLKQQEIKRLKKLIWGKNAESNNEKEIDLSTNKDIFENLNNSESGDGSDDVDITDFEELIGMPGNDEK